MKSRIIKGFVICILMSIIAAGSSQTVKIQKKNLYNISSNYWNKDSLELYFDFYETPSDADTLRPLIITLFGGGFVVGNRSYADVELFCKRFAEKGFAAASIDYRLMPAKKLSDENLQRAGYLAAQDLNSAIRFFKSNYDKYKIDTNKIIVLGQSAGAVAILHELFIDDESRPKSTFYPIDLSSLSATCHDSLLKYSADVCCAVTLWGCVLDTLIIDNDCRKTPLCLIHGENDKILPNTSGFSFGMSRLTYVFGSKPISDRLINLNYPHEYHLIENEGHAFYFDLLYLYFLNNNKFDICFNIAMEFINKNLKPE